MVTNNIPDDAPIAVVSKVIEAAKYTPSLRCLVAWETPEGIQEEVVIISDRSTGVFFNKRLGVFINLTEAIESGILDYSQWANEMKARRSSYRRYRRRKAS